MRAVLTMAVVTLTGAAALAAEKPKLLKITLSERDLNGRTLIYKVEFDRDLSGDPAESDQVCDLLRNLTSMTRTVTATGVEYGLPRGKTAHMTMRYKDDSIRRDAPTLEGLKLIKRTDARAEYEVTLGLTGSEQKRTILAAIVGLFDAGQRGLRPTPGGGTKVTTESLPTKNKDTYVIRITYESK